MILNKKILALIPARGGSKRLPKKNVLPLAGKPLVLWTIDAAIESRYIDRVILSTDDEKILSVVNRKEIEIPELRPSYLSDDNATSLDVMLHILNKYRRDEDILVLLQPTSPLRNYKHIDEALELFVKQNAEAVISVTECEQSPLWSNTLPKDGNMDGFIKPEAIQRAQDLQQYYRLNGAIYIFDIDKMLLNQKVIYNNKTFAYKMNAKESIDIDNEFDFNLAEYIVGKGSAI